MTDYSQGAFRLIKWLGRKNIRGCDILASVYRCLQRGQIATYSLGRNIDLAVPITNVEHFWDLRDLCAYEHDLVIAFCTALNGMREVTLFDCGADIGLFSAMVCSRFPGISRVLAFEPNGKVWPVVQRNISRLPGGEAYGQGLGSFHGYGRLERPSYGSWSDHASYLVPAESGIPVTTLDSFEVFGGDVAIKIDVEGGELDLLRGARETIRRAVRCLITLEAHPQVCARTGIDPSESMKFLEAIRPFGFIVSETGEWVRPSDKVLDPGRVLNIVAITQSQLHRDDHPGSAVANDRSWAVG